METVKKLSLIFLTVAALGCQSETPLPQADAATAPAQAAAEAVQQVDLKISGTEFQPASFSVAKGKPVRLTVTRDEKPTCGDVLVIPSMNIRRDIPRDQVTTIEFTPTTAGELELTCGMNMMKGKVVVQ